MSRHKFSSTICVMVLGTSLLTSCQGTDEHKAKFPHADAGKLSLISGTGHMGIERRATLPDAQMATPTGLVSAQDGSLIALVNSDGGTLLRLAPSGFSEPFEYYRTKKENVGAYIHFDISRSTQKDWFGQQNSSSMIKRPNGEIWIYANTWIAAIMPDNRAIVLGRLKLQPRKDSDYRTRIFSGPEGTVLLAHQGQLSEIQPNLDLKRYRLPPIISDVTAATNDGNQLLVSSNDTVYRIDHGRILAKNKLVLSNQKDDVGHVTDIAVDNHSGYYATTSAGIVFHTPFKGNPTPVAGMGHKPESSFDDLDNCPPVGHVQIPSNPLAAALDYPESMLLRGDQLFIADAGCSRIYALGVSNR